MTRLLLIRHGESEANSKGFFAGQYDAALMPRGIRQADKTAEYILKKYAPARVYSSDLSRAYRTAKSISDLIGVEIITDVRLREINAGNWQTETFDVLESEFSEEYGLWLSDIGRAHPSGGESVKELGERVMEALLEIAEENDGKTVAIATHATPIRAAQTIIKHGDISYMKNVPWVSNCSVTLLEYDGAWRCESVSEDGHLEEEKTVFPANV